MEAEVWKIIPDYEKYEASNLGKIRNAKTKILRKQQEDKMNGYYRIGLYNESKLKRVSVHRMIGFTFIPENPHNHPTIDHINQNRKDNRAVNLRWASYLEQNQPENKLPLTKPRITCARSVNRIDSETDEILQTYESSAEAGRWVVAEGSTKSTNPRDITAVCRGKQKTAYGFGWSYAQAEIIEEEIWKPLPSSLIQGTEGYFVSNKGRIKNNKGRISSGYKSKGVTLVSVSSNHYILRRLIASVFIPNPDNLPHVTNCNEDTHNNCVTNLKWVPLGYTHRSNITHTPLCFGDQCQ